MDLKKIEAVFIEWCITNGLYIGLLHWLSTNEEAFINKPNFRQTLAMFYEILFNRYKYLYMNTSLGNNIPLIYPPNDLADLYGIDLDGLRSTGNVLDYVYDLATIRLLIAMQEYPDGITEKCLFNMLNQTAEQAVRESMHLLKLAMMENDCEISGALLGDHGYIVNVLCAEQIIGLDICSIFNRNAMVYFSYDQFGDDNDIIHLSNIDFDNPNINLLLTEFVWLRSDNADISISEGEWEPHPSLNRSGKRGYKYNVYDNRGDLMGLILDLAKNVVKRLQL